MVKKRATYRELMCDPTIPGCFRPLTRQEIQKSNLPQPIPMDAFYNNPEKKLSRIGMLPDPNGYMGLALDAVRHFFYNCHDEANPFFKNNLYCQRYVDSYSDADDIYYQVNCWLFDRECWVKLLTYEPLHVCFDEFIRPLRNFIEEQFSTLVEIHHAAF